MRVKRNHQEELIRTGKFQPAALTLSVRPWFCLRCVGEAEPQTRQRMIDLCLGDLSKRLPPKYFTFVDGFFSKACL